MRYLVNRFVFRRDQFSQKRKIPDQLLFAGIFPATHAAFSGLFGSVSSGLFFAKKKRNCRIVLFLNDDAIRRLPASQPIRISPNHV